MPDTQQAHPTGGQKVLPSKVFLPFKMLCKFKMTLRVNVIRRLREQTGSVKTGSVKRGSVKRGSVNDTPGCRLLLLLRTI